jgi:alcohol dehydrogenase class IV
MPSQAQAPSMKTAPPLWPAVFWLKVQLVMLPVALRANREISETHLAELARVACLAAYSNDHEAATAFIDRIEALVAEIKIPTRLNRLGVRREQIPALIVGSHGNSLSGNPRDIADTELAELLGSIW